jgi:hypothetical protein
MRLPTQRFVRTTSHLVITIALGAISIHAASAADIVVPVIPAPIYVPPPPPPQPSFYASVAALYMTRSTPAIAPILEAELLTAAEPLPGNDDPADLLDASDFDFGFTFGLEGRAGVILPNGMLGFEVGGFWLRPWTATVANDDVFGLAILETDPETPVGLDAFEAYNTTRLYGFDANVVAHLNGGALQLYAGLAYIRLRDEMGINADLDAPDEFWLWQTNNRLIGPQVGARVVIGNSNPFSVELGGRVGLLHNSMTNSVLIDRMGDDDLTGADADSIWTLMAGGSITARFNLNPNFAITAGYEALWLKKVALAPHQVGVTDPINIPGPDTIGLDTYVAPFLAHGFTAGVSLRF